MNRSFAEEMRRRRDQSLFVTHFTKDILVDEKQYTPGEVLGSILHEKRILARPVGDRCAGDGKDADAVCLTEAPLLGLIVPTAPRSPSHGIGFDKRFVYQHGGMPVMYMRRDLIRKDGSAPVQPELIPYVKPFDVEEENPTYEREWRVPKDLEFEYRDVAYIIVPREERAHFQKAFPGVDRILDYEFLLEAM